MAETKIDLSKRREFLGLRYDFEFGRHKSYIWATRISFRFAGANYLTAFVPSLHRRVGESVPVCSYAFGDSSIIVWLACNTRSNEPGLAAVIS